MIDIVKVIHAEAVGGHRLRLSFSNGLSGEIDLGDLVAQGGVMLGPLADPGYFARVFVQHGVPTWPNGFDLDAIALHADMRAAGLLSPTETRAA